MNVNTSERGSLQDWLACNPAMAVKLLVRAESLLSAHQRLEIEPREFVARAGWHEALRSLREVVRAISDKNSE